MCAGNRPRQDILNDDELELGTGKVQIVDAGGEAVTVTGNKLDVNATVSMGADATVDLNKVKGTATDVNNGNVSAGTLRVTIAADSSGQVKLATGSANIGAITNTEFPLPTAQVTTLTPPAAITGFALETGGNLATVATDTTSIKKSISGAAAPTIDSYSSVAINLTTGADQVLVSSAANKQIWVYGYSLVAGDAAGQTVSLQDEDNAALTGIMEFAQYGGIVVAPSGNFSMPLFKLGTDKDLEIDITGGDVDGWLTFAIVSV